MVLAIVVGIVVLVCILACVICILSLSNEKVPVKTESKNVPTSQEKQTTENKDSKGNKDASKSGKMTFEKLQKICARELLGGEAFAEQYKGDLSKLQSDEEVMNHIREISEKYAEIECAQDPTDQNFIEFKRTTLSQEFGERKLLEQENVKSIVDQMQAANYSELSAIISVYYYLRQFVSE